MPHPNRHVYGRHRPRWQVLLTAITCTAGLVVAGAVWSAPAHAATTTQTAPTDPNVYVACGYGGESVGPDTCDSLPQALAKVLANNAASAPAATIELMPGQYCPIDVNAAARAANSSNTNGMLYRSLTIAGAGYGYVDDDAPTAINGFEAAASTFRWSDLCGNPAASAPLVSITAGYDYGRGLTLRNLAVDGNHATSTGILAHSTALTMRDVIVENATGVGLDYANDANSSLQVDASAFLDNGTGVQMGYVGTIETSTIAGNTTGLMLSGPTVHLYNDTITGNTTGIAPGPGLKLGVMNTIMLDNATSCSSTNERYPINWWEQGEGTSGNNLVGPDTSNGSTISCRATNGAAPGDVQVDGSVHLAARTTAGLTPYYSPPEVAGGAGGLCGTTDQREVAYSQGMAGTCAMGSVNVSGGSADPSAGGGGTVDLGNVHVGDSTRGSADITAVTGLVGIGDVTLDGDSAFTLTPLGNGCTLSALTPAAPPYCTIGVTAAPTSVGTVTATLTVKTTVGPVTVALSVTGTPPPPDAITVTRTDDPVGDGTCLGDVHTDDCSLRQAVAAIEPGGTITVPAGTYTLTQDTLLVAWPMTIAGDGARRTTLTLDAALTGDGSGYAVVEVNRADGVTISGLRLTGGSGDDGGRRGGGVYASDSSLTLDAVQVTGNTAEYSGGGVYSEDGQLTVTSSTINDNTTTSGDGGGGGIALESSSLTMSNSTVVGNDASSEIGGTGGGLFLSGTSTVSVTFSTIAGNTAYASAGIMDDSSAGEEDYVARQRLARTEAPPTGVTVADSVLSGNTAANGPGDCGSSTLASAGHNYVYDPDTSDAFVPCGLTDPTDVHSGDVQLSTLADNGGPSDTMLPATTSVLVDAASDADCENVTSDQRGVARPQGSHCDIGAAEVQQTPPSTTQPTPTTTAPAPPTTTVPAPPTTTVPAPSTTTQPPPTPPVTFVGAGPTRILDTRNGTGAPARPLAPQGTITLTVPNVPPAATAVVLNLTGTGLTGAPTTYVSACPTGQTLLACTGTSVLNVLIGTDTSNEIIVPIGPDGKIVLYNNAGSVDLVADLVGFQTGGFAAAGPTRVLDTRTGRGAPKARLGARQTLTLTLPNLPAGTRAVVLDLTATDLTGAPNTYVSACPAAVTQTQCTGTSVLNVLPGVDATNQITVPVGTDGKLVLYNNAGTVSLVADLVGYQIAGYTTTGPTRILDTRSGVGALTSPVGPHGSLTLTVPALPAGAAAIVLNLTGTHLIDAPSTYVSACPGAMALSACTTTSVLNVVAGVDVANEVTIPVGPGGTITLYNNAGALQLVADVAGYTVAG